MALLVSLGSVAQKITTRSESIVKDRTFADAPKAHQNQGIIKTEGAVLWSNGFDNAADWTQSFGTGQSANTGSNPGWEILSALPSNVTSQQASYAWPATFAAASGNFAFINSDLAGGTATQDAYYEIVTPIDLSASGSAALYLTFNEFYRNYYDQTFIEVSNDNGTTWTAIEVNPESQVPVNTNCVPNELEIVNITSVIGTGAWSNQVKVRFHYIGNYDWVWGIDNVKIVEAWNNDVKINNWYAATDITNTFGLDYYTIDNSQTSFPGLTFGALVNNNGAQAQTGVALKATATSGYTQTGSAISLAASANDTLSITSPYIPTAIGVDNITLTTVADSTDADATNNLATLTVESSATDYGRDNNVISGAISNTQNNSGQPLKIGNVMEMFNDWATTGAKVRLTTQAAATAGSEYWIEVYKFDATANDYAYLGATETKTISGTAGSWVSMKWIDCAEGLTSGKLNLATGDDVLLLACHNGGTSEVRFGMAQNTYEQTVLGYAADGSLFSLSSPSAIMVRFTDDPTLGVEETEVSTFSVYPNPANDAINVSLATASEATVTVLDLSGKTVKSTTMNGLNTTLSTSGMTTGVYFVNVTIGNSTTTQKIVVKK